MEKPLPDGWFAKLKGKRLGGVERRILRWLSLSNSNFMSTKWLAVGLRLGYKPTPAQLFSTYRALHRLERLGLVERGLARSLEFLPPTPSNEWKLTKLGRAVYRAYEEEFQNNKRIRWDKKRIDFWLS